MLGLTVQASPAFAAGRYQDLYNLNCGSTLNVAIQSDSSGTTDHVRNGVINAHYVNASYTRYYHMSIKLHSVSSSSVETYPGAGDYGYVYWASLTCKR